MSSSHIRLGVLADTHGLLRPEALKALAGVGQILHAGDLGSEEVLRQLETIAPVTAVRGNVDRGEWASRLPLTARITLEGEAFFLLHEAADLARYPAPADARVVVFGHSHKPSQSEREGVTYLNPGSAGPRRFSLPVTLVLGDRAPGHWTFSFVDLLMGG